MSAQQFISSLNPLLRVGSSLYQWQSFRAYAMKSPVPITWKRPEKIPCIHPSKSGDGEALIAVDKARFPKELMTSEELQTSDDLVKKIFSLEFHPYKKTVEVLRHDYVDMVKRHNHDYDSVEARLARMTCDIRDMQRHMDTNPTDRRTKVRLKETIDKRKRLLKFLRSWDYKCFEWILDKLDLVYKPDPPKDVYLRVERKRSLRALTKDYCDNIIKKRLDDYKESLEAQQESFLEQKINTLEWIMKEEKDCGVQPTITEKDLEDAKLQLAQWREKRKLAEPALSAS